MAASTRKTVENTDGNHASLGVRRVEQALEHIEQGIRDGQYLPGHRLVEVELAANSGLNIGPIREALRVLAGEGLIEIRPYRGAIVTRLTVDEIAKVYQAAKGVVYVTLQLAVKVCQSKKNRSRLNAAGKEIKKSADRPLTDFLMALTNYYFTLHEIVGNPYLTILIKRLHLGLVHREVANLQPAIDRNAIIETYMSTTEALTNGDFETARKLQFDHLDSYIRLVEETREGQ